ncbi:MAG: hypothetical protein CR955_00530 [Thiotrichales bacterium]|nr:MAG: hypothetical protein CR955_00530 [Thiotrichales bacterium]
MQAKSTTSKSPLMLFLLIGILVVATLVVISNYFLRPGLELSIKDQVRSDLRKGGIETVKVSVDGRDVLLEGFTLNRADWVKAESIVNNIRGINQVKNQLVVKNQTNE